MRHLLAFYDHIDAMPSTASIYQISMCGCVRLWVISLKKTQKTRGKLPTRDSLIRIKLHPIGERKKKVCQSVAICFVLVVVLVRINSEECV